VNIERARIHLAVVPPDFLKNFLAWQDTIPVGDKIFQRLKFLRRQGHSLPRPANLRLFEINGHVAEGERSPRKAPAFLDPAQQSFDADQEFRRIEGLREVVVGADPGRVATSGYAGTVSIGILKGTIYGG
jgi:hypothetical protein